MRFGVIIAGGSGTRLWPMSTAQRPKQLLRFIGGRSLLNVSAGRLRGLIDPGNLYVCTLQSHAASVLDDLATLPVSQVIGEPIGRDTANAIGLSAAVLAKRDADATMAIFTADHVIEPIPAFQQAVNTAFDTVDAQPDVLVTFGIKPASPATGYGYIQRGRPLAEGAAAFHVEAFREKPDLATARGYLASGEYLWNSGMFVWKAKTFLRQLEQHLPAAHEGIMRIAAAWDTPQQHSILEQVYPALPKISVDFAILEKAPNVAVVPMDVSWLDVGSWSSFKDTLTPDENGNATSGGCSVLVDCHNALAVSQDDHLVAMLGVHDMMVIRTSQATLVCPISEAEQIKRLVQQVQTNFGNRYT